MKNRQQDTTLASQFGITDDALSEIEETVSRNLDKRALEVARGRTWAGHETTTYEVQNGDRVVRVRHLGGSARAIGEALRHALTEAAYEYVELLTDTIIKHRMSKKRIHWRLIVEQAVNFCLPFTGWEKSARWFIEGFKSVGLDWKHVTPRIQTAFLHSLSLWTVPPLSSVGSDEFLLLPDLLGRRIRHIARLAPEQKPIRGQRQDLTRAKIADLRRDNPRAPIERICQLLDARRWPLLDNWKALGFNTWHATWKSSEHRSKVKRYISGVPASHEKRQQFVQ